MHTPLILTTLALIALQACSYAPAAVSGSPAQTADKPGSPAPGNSPAPRLSTAPAPEGCLADFDAFNVRKDTTLDYDEYVDGKWGKLRFVKAPTAEEEAAMKAGFRREAEAADKDHDGRLTREEFAATCS